MQLNFYTIVFTEYMQRCFYFKLTGGFDFISFYYNRLLFLVPLMLFIKVLIILFLRMCFIFLFIHLVMYTFTCIIYNH